MRSLILVSVIAATACNGDSPSGSSGAVAIIHVTPSMRGLVAGQLQPFGAVLLNARGDTLHGLSVTWHSSNSAAATVDDSGVVTGVHSGLATITATSRGIQGSSEVTTYQGGMVNADSGITYSDDHSLWVTRFAGIFEDLGALDFHKLPTPPIANVVPGSAWSVETFTLNTNYFWITVAYQPSMLPAGTNPLHLQLVNIRSGAALGGNITDTVQHTVTLETLERIDSFALVPVPMNASGLAVAGPDTMRVGDTFDFGVGALGGDIAGFGVTWSCSDAAVLECGRYGVFRALAPGAVIITARLAELEATKTVTVVQ
jgi:hypothetical protein